MPGANQAGTPNPQLGAGSALLVLDPLPHAEEPVEHITYTAYRPWVITCLHIPGILLEISKKLLGIVLIVMTLFGLLATLTLSPGAPYAALQVGVSTKHINTAAIAMVLAAVGLVVHSKLHKRR